MNWATTLGLRRPSLVCITMVPSHTLILNESWDSLIDFSIVLNDTLDIGVQQLHIA